MSMDFIRKQQKSIVTTLIFGVIILSFILWTGQDHEGNTSSRWVSVNGHDISVKNFQRALAQQTRMFSQFMQGQPMNEELMKMIERQVAMNLVMKELMVQEAKKAGVTVGGEEIIEELKKETAFHDPKLKRFSPTVYENILKANELEPREFERDIAHDITANRFRDILEWAGSVSQAEVEDTQRIENKNFTLKILTFDPLKLVAAKRVVTKPVELKAYYEKNKTQFRSESRRKVEVWALDTRTLKSELSEAEVEKYFNELKTLKTESNPLGTGAQTHALHILVNDTSDVGLKRMKELARTIQTEDQFRITAQRISEDYSNAPMGGDLGYFGKEAMVKPFADAAFDPKSPLRKVIGPVKTNYGYHLLWLIDRTGSDLSFGARAAQVRYLLSKKIQKESAQKLKDEAQKVVGTPKKLPDALKALGFQSLGTPTIDKKNSGSLPFMVAQTALTAKLNEWAGPEEASDRLFVYRVTEEVPATELSYEEAEPQVRQKLEAQKAELMVKGLQASYAKGESAAIVLLQAASESQELKHFRPYQAQLPAPLDQADTLAKAAQELSKSKSISAALLHEGQWKILLASDFSDQLPAAAQAPKSPGKLEATAKAPPAAQGAKDSAQLREELLSRKRSAFFDAYSQKLLQDAKIPSDFRKQYGLDKS